MNLMELFKMCDNLGRGSVITIASVYGRKVDEGYYPDMFMQYGDNVIRGFRIDDHFNTTVYMEGVK